jgi:hypothetical protein
LQLSSHGIEIANIHGEGDEGNQDRHQDGGHDQHVVPASADDNARQGTISGGYQNTISSLVSLEST